MQSKDIIAIAITFITGLFAGMYLYIIGFGAWMANLTVPPQEEAREFIIVSQAYGGCDDYCPSYQLRENGEYRYKYISRATGEAIFQEGVIPSELRRDVRDVLDERSLERQARPIEPPDCNSYEGGIDVWYEISIDGTEYFLDSCGTAVDGEGDIWVTFSRVWEYLELEGNNS